MGYELVCCIELKDTQVYNHLMPLALHAEVDTLWIVRSRKPEYGTIPKARYIIVSGRFRPYRWLRMLWTCFLLAARREVKAFVSFNPFPYGVIGFCAAWLRRKPMHFGLIGTDWNTHATGRWAWLLLPILRRGSFLTTFGRGAREEMIARGLASERIAVLPHSVALERFPTCTGSSKRYVAVFSGALVPNKRIDVILRGFAIVREQWPGAQLCIAGDGPLRQELEALSHHLGIAEAVDFVGFVPDVQPYLAQARTLVMASAAEGFPFSIVEAVCSGLIPVTTPANAIAEVLCDGVTALFYAYEDWKGMASCLARLLDDPDHYEQMRLNVLSLRNSFSFDTALETWRPWLSTLEKPNRRSASFDARKRSP